MLIAYRLLDAFEFLFGRSQGHELVGTFDFDGRWVWRRPVLNPLQQEIWCTAEVEEKKHIECCICASQGMCVCKSHNEKLKKVRYCDQDLLRAIYTFLHPSLLLHGFVGRRTKRDRKLLAVHATKQANPDKVSFKLQFSLYFIHCNICGSRNCCIFWILINEKRMILLQKSFCRIGIELFLHHQLISSLIFLLAGRKGMDIKREK